MASVSFFIGLGGALAGCGGSSASSFVSEYCDLVAPCCKAEGLKTDGKQCRALYGALSGAASYDAEAGDECLAQVRAAKDQADFCSVGFSPVACDRAFEARPSGSRKPGETCDQTRDCAGSAEGSVECETNFVGDVNIRKCQVQIIGKAGDGPCLATVDGRFTSYVSSSSNDVLARGYLCRVADGLHCEEDRGCVVISGIGGSCTSDFDPYACTADGRCDTKIGKCVARTAQGAPCEPSADQCVAKNYCDSASMTCKPTLAVGAACTDSDECSSSNCVNSKCDNDGLTDFGLDFVCGN